MSIVVLRLSSVLSLFASWIKKFFEYVEEGNDDDVHAYEKESVHENLDYDHCLLLVSG